MTNPTEPPSDGLVEKTECQLSREEILDKLDAQVVDVLEPSTRRQETFAEALETFSSFVLQDCCDECRAIILNDNTNTVGTLQGASTDEHDIYRISITDDTNGAAHLLLSRFHASHYGKRYTTILTVSKLQNYMLSMCNSSTRACRRTTRRLGNLMFILSFGPVSGQVRHIDAMAPNLQVCLYMSMDCPATRIYSVSGHVIETSEQLLAHWERSSDNMVVPPLVKQLLRDHARRPLRETVYTKYFAFWDTIDTTLHNFGKLYQPVQDELSLTTTRPGTTLIAGGIEVHAGPPTVRPRMFAFAIGIPDALNGSSDERPSSGADNDDMDGEIQYSPVLLHLDLSCLLFAIIEFEASASVDSNNETPEPSINETVYEAKLFLVQLLITLMRTCPNEPYHCLVSDERAETRDWLIQMADAVASRNQISTVERLTNKVIDSDTILFTPDVSKKVKKRRAKQKKKCARTKRTVGGE